MNSLTHWFDAKILPPDVNYWNHYFPEGFGESAFSAPSWHKLMIKPGPDAFEPCFLRIESENGPLTIPAFSRSFRGGRREVEVRPIAYYATPIERGKLSAADMQSIFQAIETPRICHFAWWLSPWSCAMDCLSFPPSHLGTLIVNSFDAYLLNRKGRTVSEYIDQEVIRTQKQNIRANDRNGVRVTAETTPATRATYFEIYKRAFEERNWEGEKFDANFFEGVANSLGAGGELAVVTVDDQIIGGGVILFDKYAVHLFQAAMNRQVGSGIHPHVALYKYAVEQAEKRGIDIVNLGGVNSGNEGLIRFKRSWGAQPTPVPTISWNCGLSTILDRIHHRFESNE
jgi:hypothetical protein